MGSRDRLGVLTSGATQSRWSAQALVTENDVGGTFARIDIHATPHIQNSAPE